MRLVCFALCIAPALVGCRSPAPLPVIDWQTQAVAGFGDAPTRTLGQPSVVDGPHGESLYFDGIDDALLVERHPLQGAREFTVEMFFRPDPGGAKEQRVLHLQQDASKDRILLETRLVGESWFMDSYVKSGGEGYTLFARRHLHPLGRWFHVALVVDGERMTQFVDGQAELSRGIEFLPPGAGRTSLGVRINLVDWFRGAVRRVRFTPRALTPDEFFEVDRPDS